MAFDNSLEGIFGALDEACGSGTLPVLSPFRRSGAEVQMSLFDVQDGTYSGSPLSGPGESAGESVSALLLRELSLRAYEAVVLAWMSEAPIEPEIIRYGWQILKAAGEAAARAAGRTASGAGFGGGLVPGVPPEAWARLPEAREAAERAAERRLDPNTAVVLEAASRTRKESHR
ncbi:MAG: hypothetical protein LBI85_03510, partial [Spirochaetaceae bacterium]|nr:hypothetical protein [Spirochaetaceae bacterium]